MERIYSKELMLGFMSGDRKVFIEKMGLDGWKGSGGRSVEVELFLVWVDFFN